MQPIMEIIPEDDVPVPLPRERRRIPIVSSDFYSLTVFCWVLSVATVGVIVGFVCTEFFSKYISLLLQIVNRS